MADYKPSDSAISDRGLVNIQGFAIGGLDYPDLRQLTIKEIVLGENILTPGLQMAITFHNSIYLPAGKWFDRMKAEPVRFTLTKEWFNGNYSLAMSGQIAYRLDNRSFKPVNVGHTEEFTLHACHESLLNDARALMSKSWKCTSPSDIVKKALECIGVSDTSQVLNSEPQRDYIAENIHPFQVINQQCNVALYNGVPDFVHFMTFGWDGGGSTPKHHFKSIKYLCDQGSIWTYRYSDTGQGRGQDNPVKGEFANPEAVISFEFPCDFDYLTDILNGLENGQNKNTVATLNPFSKSMSKYGDGGAGCGIGGYNYKMAITNMGTAKDQNSCNLDVEQHLLKRQARMSLLDRDRIALRMVVPWNPALHVGKVIRFEWMNKYEPGTPIYGTDTYLITGLSHVIKTGGFSTTAIDCVSTTVGGGEA